MLLLFLFASPTSASNLPNKLCHPDDNADDCHALVDLYKATGSKIHGFANGTQLCNWENVVCDGTSHRVTELQLPGYIKAGTIPNSLGLLSELRKLYLIDNNLSGTIPDTIGQLTALTILDLNNNQLSGSVGDAQGWQELTKLKYLDLKSNQFNYWLGNGLCEFTLPHLSQCNLLNNSFLCPLPSCAGTEGRGAEECQATCKQPLCIHQSDPYKCYEACSDGTKFAMEGLDTAGVCEAKYGVVTSKATEYQCADGVTNIKYCKPDNIVAITVTTKSIS